MEQQEFIFQSVPAHEGVKEKERESSPRVYTVSEIVSLAEDLIEEAFPSVWVVGEVSGYRVPTSGHQYFSLKDENSVLPAAIFKGTIPGPMFELKDGLEVICRGTLSLYSKKGIYQITIDYIEPKGLGELQLAFEQRKKKYAEEGLFDPARKRRLPFLPRKVGIVTSPTGAAIRDLLNIMRRRFPNIDILISPARVEGEGSASEIARAIELLNKRDDIDVIIVGRGGGSIEDLWAFNEDEVVRAIYNSRIPVVSAVGHEIDFTIADFVADLRAPTPSAAAELVVPIREELRESVKRLRERLQDGLMRYIKTRSEILTDLKSRLIPPTKRFPDRYRDIDNMRDRLVYSIRSIYKMQLEQLGRLQAELRHLSPLSILSKGYAIVTKKGEAVPVRSSKDLRKGDEFEVRLYKGRLDGKVTKIYEG